MLLCGEFCSFLYSFELDNQLLGMESYIIYMAFHPQAVRIARLRGEGPSAPGRTLLGSEEEAARLRGEKEAKQALIIKRLQKHILSFRDMHE